MLASAKPPPPAAPTADVEGLLRQLQPVGAVLVTLALLGVGASILPQEIMAVLRWRRHGSKDFTAYLLVLLCTLHKDMSPSSMHAAEASFEHRLQRSTVVPATDRAIEVLVKMSRAAGNDLSAVDFAANPGSLYPNSPQVDRSSRHTTLSFQSSAFRS